MASTPRHCTPSWRKPPPFTWIKNGKPDVGMCLNAPLAGLVGITAGCASLDAPQAVLGGVQSGDLLLGGHPQAVGVLDDLEHNGHGHYGSRSCLSPCPRPT